MPNGHNLAFWTVKRAITSLMFKAAYRDKYKKKEYDNSFRQHLKVQFFFRLLTLLWPRSTLATRFPQNVASGMKKLT